MNFYQKWKESIEDVRFFTSSPAPFSDYYYNSDKGLKFCRNFPGYHAPYADKNEIKKYFFQQISILRYNNPTFEKIDIRNVMSNRIMKWPGNANIKEEYKELKKALEWNFSVDDFEETIEFTTKRHWYSDRIEKLSGYGKQKSEKSIAKAKARKDFIHSQYREEIFYASEEYRMDNFKVRPTVKHLDNALLFSRPTIVKHGEGLYIRKGDNIKGLVEGARAYYPQSSSKEIAELLGINERTIERYWK